MKNLSAVIILFFLFVGISLSDEGIIQKSKANVGVFCTVYLVNGDIISGEIAELISDKDNGSGIKINSELGKAIIFEYQIKNIETGAGYYKYSNRSLLLPTAYPIGKAHFVGFTELALLSAGAGITDYVSIMGAHSIIPGVNYESQIFYVNAKFTLFNDVIDKKFGNFAAALGGNYARVGKDANMFHLYGGASLDFGTTVLSANIFYKLSGGDFYEYRFNENIWRYAYLDGAFGLTFAIDKELSPNGLHLFVELLNGDINNYKKTAVASGIRFSNNKFGADLGLAIAGGYPLPIMQFFWTPF